MATFPYDIVGFDLDGTLFDTSADLAAALNHVLHGLGQAPLSPMQAVGMVAEPRSSAIPASMWRRRALRAYRWLQSASASSDKACAI